MARRALTVGVDRAFAVRMRRLAIMIVDDEQSFIEALAELLRLDGHEVVTASGPQKALELIAAKPRDLVISDWMMAGMSGASLHATIRARGQEPACFVLMSAAPESLVNPRGNERFLGKPLRLDALRAVVAECADALTHGVQRRG